MSTPASLLPICRTLSPLYGANPERIWPFMAVLAVRDPIRSKLN